MKLKKIQVLDLPKTWILIDSKRDSEEAKTKWLQEYFSKDRFGHIQADFTKKKYKRLLR